MGVLPLHPRLILFSLPFRNHFKIFFERDNSLIHLIRLDKILIGINIIVINEVNICLVNRMKKYFLNRQTFLQGDKSDFGTHFHDFVLERHLIKQFRLIHLYNLLLLSLSDPALSSFLFKLFNLSLYQMIEQWLCTVFGTVESTEGVDKVFDEDLHVILILNNQIHISPPQIQRNTIPRMKWHLLQFFLAQRINVLSQDPES